MGQLWLFVLLVALPALVTCTEAKLEPIPREIGTRDDKLEITGSICTSEPDTLVFPLRLLFVVDTSSSMIVVDPPDPITGETNRERAVRETWTRLLEQSPEGVEVGIIRFSAESQSTVAIADADGIPQNYFTADPDRLAEGTAALREVSRTTNYINALGEAYYEIRNELINAELESLPLSKYIVIFLSDGVPNVDASDARDLSRDRIMASVRALRELTNTFRVGDFSFHTAFLASGQAVIDQEAQGLLREMARVGGGNFRNFPSGEELNFLFAELTVLRRVFTLERIGAFNTNVVMDRNQIPARPDPVEDVGLGDVGDADASREDATAVPDDDVGVSDVDAGPVVVPGPQTPLFIDLTKSGYPECGEPLIDTDGDGLSDLVELEIGTSPFLRDTDGDGLNDFLEWQFRESGLDALNPRDSQCYVPSPCVDSNNDGYCDCLLDANLDGICDCVSNPNIACLDDLGHDCLDLDEDGLCDCPDLDGDGYCDYSDRTGDGMHDCEEVLYGTSQRGVDSDGDGYPDIVEIRFQTDPVRNDAQDDLDLDGVPNGIEIQAATDPNCNDSRIRSQTAYRYQLQQISQEGNKTCYEFGVSNITLVPTMSNPDAVYPGNNWNRVLLYAGEVPFDDPRASGRFRFACVMVNYNPDGSYKNPPSGRVRLSEADFVEVGTFDPDLHCIWP
ncbi:MAG: VWA domain-containing protein [Bradymonadaceae bacterium]|nr:VWA domain-containing protein [Lujinxingiaceae bacterium]